MVGLLCFILMLPRKGFSVYSDLYHALPINRRILKYISVALIETLGALLFIFILLRFSDLQIFDTPTVVLLVASMFSPAAAFALIYFDQAALQEIMKNLESKGRKAKFLERYHNFTRPALALKMDVVFIIFVLFVFIAFLLDSEEINATYKLNGNIFIWSVTVAMVSYYSYISGHAFVAFSRLFYIIEVASRRGIDFALDFSFLSALHQAIWTAFLCYCAGLFMLPILVFSPTTDGDFFHFRQFIAYAFAGCFFLFFVYLFSRLSQLSKIELEIRRGECLPAGVELESLSIEQKINSVLCFVKLSPKYRVLDIWSVFQVVATLVFPIAIDIIFSFLDATNG